MNTIFTDPLTDTEVWDDVEVDEDESDFASVLEEEPSTSTTVEPMEDDRKASQLCDWLVLYFLHLQTVFHMPDKAMISILLFFSTFFTILSKISPVCSVIALKFPKSLYLLRKYNKNRNTFTKYVVCKKCHFIYDFQDCIERSGVRQQAKLCCFQEFPNHPHQRMRANCNNPLLKTVELRTGRKMFYPFLTYCYLGLATSIKLLFNQSNFYELLISSHKCFHPSSTLKDVSNGKIWSDFQSYNEKPFLSDPLCLALCMNVDFFQPYKHVNYSVGAVYLIIMNLPRKERYKRENLLLIGLLPGPQEPKHDINTYLNPLVLELQQFLKGVNVTIPQKSTQKLVKCALLCVSCDIPAGRKVCGFMGHNARLGCSRCSKEFPGSVGCMDYSGFDREFWTARDPSDHRDTGKRWLKCTTKKDRVDLESSTGYRYSVLLELPYFDSTRMLVIDPMHNLFLGTGKHMIKAVWLGKEVIGHDKFDIVQSRVDNCKVPPDIGRIPHKISSHFSSFTADQHKNWIIYFSLIALRGILLNEDLECWRHYVLACRLLSQHKITIEQLCLADALLMKFCRRTESMYGPSIVTPNMHLHAHLKQCILDYGPIHGFWCFPFERFNGLLGEFPNNKKSIEVQLMNRFSRENSLMSAPVPKEFAENLSQHIPQCRQVTGSLLQGSTGIEKCINDSLPGGFSKFSLNCDLNVVLPTTYTKQLFTSDDVLMLRTLYSKLYETASLDEIEVNFSFRKYKTICINGKQIGSYKSSSSNSSIVLAVWNHDLFETSYSLAESPVLHRPVQVNYFCHHNITVDGKSYEHTLMCCSWFQFHPKKDSCGKPVTIWEHELFETSAINILPVQFILSRTISLVDIVDELGRALLVVPCIDF